jgi:uncharacterized protein (TIGR03435 family)
VRVLRLVLLWLACIGALAQEPAFDVARFHRLVQDPRHGARRDVTPTSLNFQEVTLGNLLSWAYGYEHWQVIGPNWRDRPTDVVYSVEARTERRATPAEMKLMVQRLIRERLGLSFHRETRDLPVYVLVVGPGGHKLHPSTSAGDPSIKQIKAYVTDYERVSMRDFARTLDPPFTSRHVVDETGLAGTFDFTVDLSPYVLDSEGRPVLDARGAIDTEGANLLALPKQLGLKLERKARPMDVMVIDAVRKAPIEN